MGKKVLVVDDIKVNVNLLTEILEDEGYTVYAVDKGRVVADTARKVKPDIILLDIMMPEMDGFEVCEVLKKDFELKDIPIIMITAKVDGQDVKRGLELGAFDYIKKPADEVGYCPRAICASFQRASGSVNGNEYERRAYRSV